MKNVFGAEFVHQSAMSTTSCGQKGEEFGRAVGTSVKRTDGNVPRLILCHHLLDATIKTIKKK